MTRKEQIIEILQQYCDFTTYSAEKNIYEAMADAILAIIENVPDDEDIDNAALNYVDEVDNPFARKLQRNAYIDGAKDMRDNNIFIMPKDE